MQVSQSLQMAPFNNRYEFSNTTGPAYELHQPSSQMNSYKGAILQQAGSVITDIHPQTATQLSGGDFAVYGTEFGECLSCSNRLEVFPVLSLSYFYSITLFIFSDSPWAW